MRILNLNLLAVGPFTARSIDLSAGGQGLHLIYGDNEAGKSSALRALRAFFFEFPVRSNDVFLHRGADLRVGAELRLASGEVVRWTRRKGNRATLMNGEGKAVEAAELVRFTGGITSEQFDDFFGINHGALVEGGQSLLSGKGNLGEALFAAGTGGGKLKQLMAHLDAEAENLFKPRGRDQVIAQALNEREALLRGRDEVSLSASAWVDLEKEISEAQAQLKANAEELDASEPRRTALEGLKKMIPLVGERGQLLGQLRELGDVPELPADFGTRREKAWTEFREARGLAQSEAEQIEKLAGRLAGIIVRSDVLERETIIEELAGRSKEYGSDKDAAPALAAGREADLKEAERILKGLRPELDLARAEELRISVARRSAIEELASRHATLVERLKQATQLKEEAEKAIRQRQAKLGALAGQRDGVALERRLKDVRKRAASEQQVSLKRRELAEAESKAAGQLARLGLGGLALEAAEKLALPGMATVKSAEGRLAELEKAQGASAEKLAEAEEKIEKLKNEVEAQRRGGLVATEEDLLAAREKRQRGWQLVRGVWLEGRKDAAAEAAFGGGAGLPEAYERSVADADGVADALRKDADGVARLAMLVNQMREGEGEKVTLAARAADARGALEAARKEWEAMWRAAGVPAPAPAEARAWLVDHGNLVERIGLVRAARQAVEEGQAAVAESKVVLLEARRELGEKVDEAISLAGEMELCAELVEAIKKAERDRAGHAEALDEAREKLAREEGVLAEANGEMERWRGKWAGEVATLGAQALESPAIAREVVGQVTLLFEKLADAEKKERQLKEAQERIRRFEADAVKLAGVLQVDAEGVEARQIAARISALLKVAREAAVNAREVTKAREEGVKRKDSAGQRQKRAGADLEELCRIAQCENAEELQAVETRARQRDKLAAEIRAIERNLGQIAAGKKMDEVERQVAEADVDGLGSQIREIGEKIATLKTQREAIIHSLGTLQEKQRRMDGSSKAAEEAEKAQMLAARVIEKASRYARVKIAGGLLRRAI